MDNKQNCETCSNHEELCCPAVYSTGPTAGCYRPQMTLTELHEYLNQEKKMDTERITTQQLLERHRTAYSAILAFNKPKGYRLSLRDLESDIARLEEILKHEQECVKAVDSFLNEHDLG